MIWPLMPLGSLDNDTALALAGLLPLAAILYAAVRSALRENRIPNQLVLVGIVGGVLLHTVLPPGDGFLALWPGGVGPWRSLLGLAIGAFAVLPFYFSGAMGGGDVKLMAAVGAFLGPADIVPAVLGTLLAGGMVALAVALHFGHGGRLFRNFLALLRAGRGGPAMPLVDTPVPIATAPYAVAVAVGTLVGALWVAAGR